MSSLLATKKADFNSTTPLTETSNLRSAFDALLQRLDAVSRYVDDVVVNLFFFFLFNSFSFSFVSLFFLNLILN